MQIKPDGLEIFVAVVLQVNFAPDYTPAQLKEDMLTYINENVDYFTVTNFTLFFFLLNQDENFASSSLTKKLL